MVNNFNKVDNIFYTDSAVTHYSYLKDILKFISKKLCVSNRTTNARIVVNEFSDYYQKDQEIRGGALQGADHLGGGGKLRASDTPVLLRAFFQMRGADAV